MKFSFNKKSAYTNNAFTTIKTLFVMLGVYIALSKYPSELGETTIVVGYIVLALWLISEIHRFITHVFTIKNQIIEITDKSLIINNKKTKKLITIERQHLSLDKIKRKNGRLISISVKVHGVSALTIKDYNDMDKFLECLEGMGG